MSSPTVSVVMTVYNAKDYLQESITSVLNQTHHNLQFIIVDDGSTDQSAAIIQKFAEQDRRIEFYQLEENRHISYATNVGFAKVHGDYLAIMDSDDIWVKDKLEKQLQYLKLHPEHKGCFTWVDLIDENGADLNDRLPELRNLFAANTDTREEWLRFFFFIGNRLNNPSSLVDARVLPEIGGHNLFYIQATDLEWWVRFTLKYSFGILEEPLLKYRRILSSDNNVSIASVEHDARFYNEHMQIRYHFFDAMDDELFIRTFKDHFRCPDSSTPEELACEKAFLICQNFSDSTCYSAPGLLKLEELLTQPKTALLLKERYHFSTRECGEYTGTHIYNDPWIQKSVRRADDLENWNSLSQLHIAKLEQQINDRQEEITSLNSRIADLENQSHALNTKLLSKEQDLQSARQRIQEQTESIGELTDALNTITNSTSWKITLPIRKLMDKFHR